jgi:hypothetical protein
VRRRRHVASSGPARSQSSKTSPSFGMSTSPSTTADACSRIASSNPAVSGGVDEGQRPNASPRGYMSGIPGGGVVRRVRVRLSESAERRVVDEEVGASGQVRDQGGGSGVAAEDHGAARQVEPVGDRRRVVGRRSAPDRDGADALRGDAHGRRMRVERQERSKSVPGPGRRRASPAARRTGQLRDRGS